jgi:hypothetical protein
MQGLERWWCVRLLRWVLVFGLALGGIMAVWAFPLEMFVAAERLIFVVILGRGGVLVRQRCVSGSAATAVLTPACES